MQAMRWGNCRQIEEPSSGNDGGLAVGLECYENDYGGVSKDQVSLLSSKAQLDEMNDATVMLAAIEGGDRKAAEQLLVLVYDELRRLAASKLAHEAPGQTLQPTALVHEAWLRLVGDQNPSFKDRDAFLSRLRRSDAPHFDRSRPAQKDATSWRGLSTR